MDIQSGKMQLGGAVTAKVVAKRTDSTNAPIGKNQLVMYAAKDGNKFNDIDKNIEVGDTVTIHPSDLNEAANHFADSANPVVNAVTGLAVPIVQDGKVSDDVYSYADVKALNPRTAIGVKKDGSVVLFEIDGRQNGWSAGMNGQGIAEYMVDQGCEKAYFLDGGGSSTAVARLPGDRDLSLLNRPSDGSERADSNCILLVASSGATGTPARLSSYPGKIQILAGSQYDLSKLSVKATDANDYPASMPGVLTYTADSKIGAVSGTAFTASSGAGKGRITLRSGSIQGIVDVEVVSRVDAIHSDVPMVSTAPGTSAQVGVTATLNGRQVTATPAAFQWSLAPGSIGTIDSASGRFTAAGQKADGNLSIKGGGQTITLPVAVGADMTVDTGTEWSYLDTGADAKANAKIMETPYSHHDDQHRIPDLSNNDAWAYPTSKATTIGQSSGDGVIVRSGPSGSASRLGLNALGARFEIRKTQVDASDSSLVWELIDGSRFPEDNTLNGWYRSTYTEAYDYTGADTSGWKKADGPFGVSSDDKALNGSKVLLSKQGGKVPTSFFVHHFNVADPGTVQTIVGKLSYNDAAIVYLNGYKVKEFNTTGYASNLSEGAASPVSGVQSGSFTLSDSHMLMKGDNVLAVEVHQMGGHDDDAYFNFDSLLLSTQTAPVQPQVKDVTLQPGSSPSSRNFAWSSSTADTGYVQIALKSDYDGYNFPVGKARVFQSGTTTTANGWTAHDATVSPLKTNTEYVYRVGNADQWSATYSFKTQGVGGSYSFLLMGDPQIGSGGNAANDVIGWKQTLGRATETFPDSAFIMSAGDQVEVSNDEFLYDDFFTPEQIPGYTLSPTVGNHDCNVAYRDHFNVPNLDLKLGNAYNTGGDYWYRYGDTLFMDLNSNNASAAEHKEFMQKAIGANSDATWRIVTFHHAPYSTGPHTTDSQINDIRTNWENAGIFDDLGIQVVLNGHDHSYTRSFQMERGRAVSTAQDGKDLTDPKASFM